MLLRPPVIAYTACTSLPAWTLFATRLLAFALFGENDSHLENWRGPSRARLWPFLMNARKRARVSFLQEIVNGLPKEFGIGSLGRSIRSWQPWKMYAGSVTCEISCHRSLPNRYRSLRLAALVKNYSILVVCQTS